MLSRFQTSVLLSLLLCTFVPVCANQGVQPFSADITFTANAETRIGRIYSDGRSIRIESEATVPGQKKVVFLQLETGLAQAVNFQERVYIEYPYGTATDAQFVRYMRDAKINIEHLGMEFLEGQQCEKLRVTTTYKGQVYTSIEWRSKASHGLLVKNQDVKGQWSAEYKNIKPGEQPTSLFELPSGYDQIAFSRDWISVVKQIEAALGPSQGISIARKAGLRVEEDSQLPDYQSATFIDPVTGSTVLHTSVNSDTLRPPQ